MSLVDVCRLCLSKENLVWIFDKRFESSENMKEVIYVTTGVEITETDIITQKVCKKCCQVTIKMFQFRGTSLKNDHQLREQSKQLLNQDVIIIPNTEVTIKNCAKQTLEENEVDKAKKEVKKPIKPVYKIHPSVRELFKAYPQIKLPTVCLKSHITPEVCMELDAVESYFKVRKLDIVEHTKLALKIGRVATKKTSAPAKSKTPQPSSSNTHPKTHLSENKVKPRIGPASKIAERSSLHKPSELKLNPLAPITQFKIIPITQTKNTPDLGKIRADKDKPVDKKTGLKAKHSRDVTPEKTPEVKKIKLSVTNWETPKKEPPKLNVIESVGLVPKSTSVETSGLSYVANTSVPLHICNICNSVQYSAKDLRKHQQKHLRCQFCKLKCKSLEHKSIHVESACLIKNTMNNLPNIYLDKIEFNLQVRRRFPSAFLDFPTIEGMYDVQNRPSKVDGSDSDDGDNLDFPDSYEDIDNTESTKKLTSTSKRIPQRNTNVEDCKPLLKDLKAAKNTGPSKHSTPPNTIYSLDDIIEIMSDDDDDAPTSSATASESTRKQHLSGNGDHDKSPIAGKSNDGKLPVPPLISISRVVPEEENLVYSTVSIVKPDIKIKGNAIVDNIDPKASDLQVLRELLSIYQPVQVTVDSEVQTELPSNRAIIMNRADMTTELHSLKQQLYAYKVPVTIKKGPFNVSYVYRKRQKQPKKLSLWNYLSPIDLKSINVNLAVSESVNVSLPTASSANINFPTSSSANINLPISTSANVTLPISTTANVTSATTNLPVSSLANMATSQSSNAQSSNVVILPSTATYNSSGIFSLPPQPTATPNYVSIPITSDNSTFSNSVAATSNILNMNPLLNSCLDIPNASVPVVDPASHIDVNSGLPLGVIRVKNVWELT